MPDRTGVAIEWEESSLAPHEAFERLANPDRFAVLAALARADAETLSFSTLYERSPFDDTGQFNYHLDKLVGPFVRKTDAGYELRHAAVLVYRLAVSGLLSDRGTAELTTIDAPCLQCGATSLTAVYEGDRFWVRCPDCERRAAVAPFPPRAAATHDTERVPEAFDRYTMGTALRAAENVCPWCAGPLTATLEPADETWPTVEWVIGRHCGHCRGWIYTRVSELLRFEPAVIAFFYDHGVDILGSPLWECESIMAEAMTVTTGTDDWTATVTLAADGDDLRLGLGDALSVSALTVLSEARRRV
jgi:hypothetical protein